jgi:antitoxin HigA-1
MVHVAKRHSDRCPTHPAALLREDVIPATGRTKADIAHLLGISRLLRTISSPLRAVTSGP